MRPNLHLLLLGLLAALANRANAEGRLAIIIDDIGYNQIQSERAARLNGAITLAILPFTPHGNSAAKIAHQLGKELMLHLPMSNTQQRPLGNGGLASGMDKTQFLATLRQDIRSLPLIRGINNHMGSQLTQEPEAMEWLMTELQSYPLYFVDSRTSKHTQAFNTAQAKHIPSISRDVFLDDDETPAAIRTQLERAVKLAQVRGHAVAIGHPYASTLAVLEQIEPLLKKYDTQLVFVSALLPAPLIKPKWLEKTIEHSLDYCPAPITPTDIDNTNIDLSDTIRAAIYPLLNIK